MKFDKTNWRVKKIISLKEAGEAAAKLKEEGKKLVTVNGSFDLLHIGHIDQLEGAKKQGDVLFVGINSDKSVKSYKGNNRPYVSEWARAGMLAALQCVDYVIIIDEPAKEMQNYLLRAIKPDIHANGEEYGPQETWLEWPVMREVGAVGYSVKMRNDFSTTAIIRRVKDS